MLNSTPKGLGRWPSRLTWTHCPKRYPGHLLGLAKTVVVVTYRSSWLSRTNMLMGKYQLSHRVSGSRLLPKPIWLRLVVHKCKVQLCVSWTCDRTNVHQQTVLWSGAVDRKESKHMMIIQSPCWAFNFCGCIAWIFNITYCFSFVTSLSNSTSS